MGSQRPLLKICGLTQPQEAAAVAAVGCDAIGVIAAPDSPRFLATAQRPEVWQAVASAAPACRRVLVVVDPDGATLTDLEAGQGHQVVQLHGNESPARCAELAARLQLPLWKALRVRSAADLARAEAYAGVVEALLLDAWVPGAHGGTGRRLPLEWLQEFRPSLPWWLAGGLGPGSAAAALQQLEASGASPVGIDVSSGVETAPGRKNLEQVRLLWRELSCTELPAA